ncbi:Bcr/CflA family drug resistance efflux transporter [Bacteroidia bacterium]|nr:Bcr/CflA family drug resistance efflux transporter [Bacteroidia bacterium]
MKKSANSILIALIPLLTISFVSKIAPYIYIPSLPDIAEYFGLSRSEAGSTMSVYYLALSLTLLIAGVVGDVWDKKRLLAGASTVIFSGAVISSAASQFGLMLSGWALQAIGAATIIIVGQTWIGQSSNKKNITSLFSYLTIILSFAPLVAPVVGGVVTDTFSWRYNFYIVAALSLFASLFIGKATPPPPVQNNSISIKQVAASYYRILFQSKFAGLISASLACFLFQGALMNYSSFMFINQLGVKPSFYGLISVPVVVGVIIGQFPVIYMEKKRGIVAAHLFSSVVAVSALLASLLFYIITGTHSVVELALIIMVFSIGFGGHTLLAIRNVMTAFASKRSHSSALVNFLNQFAGYIASVIVQLLFALFGSAMQIHNIVCVFAIILIIATFPIFKKSYLKVISC